MIPELGPEQQPRFTAETDAASKAAIIRTAYETIDKLGTDMVNHSFLVMQRLLAEDRDALAVEPDPETGDFTVVTKTSFGINEALWEFDEPQWTLTFALESKELFGDDDTLGDRLEVSILTQPDYVYPEPLDPENVPPTIFLRYIPDVNKQADPARYVITSDENSVEAKYRLYEYTSIHDTGSQEVFDDFSEHRIEEFTTRLVPAEATIMLKLFTAFGNFELIPQTETTRYTKKEL